MRKFLLCSVSFALIVIGGGCAASKTATELAAKAGRLTLEYEQARDAKVAAEKEFYAKQKEALRTILGGTSAITDPRSAEQDKTTLGVKGTVAYGRIRTDTERDAIALTEALIASPAPQAWSGITNFLASGLKDDWESYRETQRRREQINKDLVVGLIMIDQQTEQLKNIRNDFLELEKEPALQSRLKQFWQIGKAAIKQFQESEKK